MKTKECPGLKRISNSKGQFAIESVLLVTILIGGFMLITKYARDNNLISKLVTTPFTTNVAAMTAFGVWHADGCRSPGKARQTIGKCHPNSISRSVSSAPGL